MGEFKEFGPAFKFTHHWKSSFWDVYGNDEKPDSLTEDEWNAIETVGEKASSEAADFLENIRDTLIKKCEEYGYGVKSKSSRGRHEDDWTCYFSISKSKRANHKQILQVWFGFNASDYILRRGIWLENDRDRNIYLLKHWSFDNCHISKKGEDGDWWGSSHLVFSNMPLDNLSKPDLYVEKMNDWFDKLFGDKKWLNILESKDK